SIENILAASWRIQAAQQVHQCRFARSGWPHNRHKLAALDLETYPAQRQHIDIAHPVRLAQVAHLDHCVHTLYPLSSSSSSLRQHATFLFCLSCFARWRETR